MSHRKFQCATGWKNTDLEPTLSYKILIFGYLTPVLAHPSHRGFSQGLASSSRQDVPFFVFLWLWNREGCFETLCLEKAWICLILAFFKHETLGFFRIHTQKGPEPHWPMLTQDANTSSHLFLINLMAVHWLFLWRLLSPRSCLRLQTSRGKRPGTGDERCQLPTEGRYRSQAHGLMECLLPSVKEQGRFGWTHELHQQCVLGDVPASDLWIPLGVLLFLAVKDPTPVLAWPGGAPEFAIFPLHPGLPTPWVACWANLEAAWGYLEGDEHRAAGESAAKSNTFF